MARVFNGWGVSWGNSWGQISGSTDAAVTLTGVEATSAVGVVLARGDGFVLLTGVAAVGEVNSPTFYVQAPDATAYLIGYGAVLEQGDISFSREVHKKWRRDPYSRFN